MKSLVTFVSDVAELMPTVIGFTLAVVAGLAVYGIEHLYKRITSKRMMAVLEGAQFVLLAGVLAAMGIPAVKQQEHIEGFALVALLIVIVTLGAAGTVQPHPQRLPQGKPSAALATGYPHEEECEE